MDKYLFVVRRGCILCSVDYITDMPAGVLNPMAVGGRILGPSIDLCY
jgi:hypothetical protein